MASSSLLRLRITRLPDSSASNPILTLYEKEGECMPKKMVAVREENSGEKVIALNQGRSIRKLESFYANCFLNIYQIIQFKTTF
jgi:hypothetical protein